MRFIETVIDIAFNFLAILVIVQLATLFHELGHALAGLIFTKEDVNILLGRRRSKRKLRKLELGRLVINFNGIDPLTGFSWLDESRLTKFQRLVFYAGGPLVSLLMGIIFYLIGRNIDHQVVSRIAQLFSSWLLVQFLFTAIPLEYPAWFAGYGGQSSDGRIIARLIKSDK